MPDVNVYTFKHKELLELLIKRAGLHEGKWQLTVNFGLGGINAGTNPDDVVPAAVVAIQSVGLTRAQQESPPALTMDAAEINPAST